MAAATDLERKEGPSGEKRAFSDRVPALDGIRGLALIQVLAFHFAILDEVPSSTVLDKFTMQVIEAGWIAMDSFFVLSGFLITGILYDAKTSGVRHYFRNFYARRSLRIFPAHYVFLIAVFTLVPLFMAYETRAVEAMKDGWHWFVTYVANIRIGLDHGRRADLYFTGHLWSLSVEEQFYVLWPVAVWLLRRRALMLLCLGAILIAIMTRVAMVAADMNTWIPYTFTVTRMDALAIGSMLALAVRDPHDFAVLKQWLPRLGLVAAALIAGPALVYGELDIFDSWGRMAGHTSLAVLYALLVLTAATSVRGSFIDRTLGSKPLATLGKFSYAMYLVHLPVAYIIFRELDIGPAIPSVLGSHLPGQLVFMAAAFVPTLTIGWLSWNFLESRALRLKDRFPYTAGEDAAQRWAAPATATRVEEAPRLDQRPADHLARQVVAEEA